ncbi:MAG: pyridoxal phosphate-dependent aminotransferase [Pseudomonadales bacterium]|nr:pyridoxal phosphate-dependent aminotransferase [Pseudomonadales bacterium]
MESARALTPAVAPTLDSKLPEVGTTIFTVMSALAQQHGALNLSQGFPDFDGPPALLERVTHYLTHGRNQYAPMTGVPSLREALAGKVAALYGCVVDAEREVTITSGATEALFCAIHAVVRPGDEVIVFDPAYDSYAPAVALAGGRCVHLPLRAPEYAVDWQQVRDAIGARTRLIIVNSPHNPTGSVFSSADLDALAEVVRDTGVFLLADEVYEHIVFDGAEHQSLLRRPELAARAFVVSSMGKTYHTTGWKIGYCVAPAALSAEFRKVHQYVTFCTNTPVQLALADFLVAHPEHHLELPAFYQAKRDRFCALLEGSRFQVRPAAGTYFQLLGYEGISDEDDVCLSRRLTEEQGIASIPVSVFHRVPTADRVLRFCFAKDDATLVRAAAILCAI